MNSILIFLEICTNRHKIKSLNHKIKRVIALHYYSVTICTNVIENSYPKLTVETFFSDFGRKKIHDGLDSITK